MTAPIGVSASVTKNTIGASALPCANLVCSACGLIARLAIVPVDTTPHPVKLMMREYWQHHVTAYHATSLSLDTTPLDA